MKNSTIDERQSADVARDAGGQRRRPPARHQQQPGSDRPVETGEPQIRPRPWRRAGIDPVAGRIGNAGGGVAHRATGHRVRTLPFSVSKVLPPFLRRRRLGQAAEEPSTSLRLGAGRSAASAACCATAQTFFCMPSVFLWPAFSWSRDLRRNSAFGRIGFDIFDHLDFGLAEISDQLAGLVRRRMAVAGGLDQLAALLRLFAQRHETLHAGVRRPPPDGGAGAALERRAGDRRGAAGRERRRRADDAAGAPFTGGKAGSLALAGLAIGQRRRKRALREGLTRRGGSRRQRSAAQSGGG